MMTNNPKLKKEVQKIKNLPTLPAVYVKMFKLLNDIDSNISDIIFTIENDQSMTSKVLKLSNSSYYGFSRQITSIRDAVTLLGFTTVLSLTVSISVFDNFFSSKESNFNLNAFWYHSISTAFYSTIISKELGIKNHNEIFVGSLLHDIGKIILLLKFHDKFIKAVDYSRENKLDLYKSESIFIGTNHVEVSRWLMDRWNFPQAISNIICYHHHPVTHTFYSKFEFLIASLANSLAIYNNHGFSGDNYNSLTIDILLDNLDIKNKKEFLTKIEKKFQSENHKMKALLEINKL